MSEQTTPRTVEEAAREEAFRDALRRADALDRFEHGSPHPDYPEQAGRMPSVEEVAAAVALAQNVPFVGPKQRRIAERVVALWGAP